MDLQKGRGKYLGHLFRHTESFFKPAIHKKMNVLIFYKCVCAS